MNVLVYGKNNKILGSIDQIFSNTNPGFSALFLAEKISDDKSKFFKTRKEARSWIVENAKKIETKKSKSMATAKSTSTKKPKKRTSATSLCRKVIKVPGLNSKGQLLKGWHYVNGKPVKVKPATKKKATTKPKAKSTGLKKPSAKQSAAQKKFAANAKKAAALVKSGKAKNISSAWRMIKK